jgi:uncharacterized membrane protein YfcA
MEYLHILMLFAIGIVAGMLNVMAGGGSALTLPFLIFLGLDSSLANGTNRIAIFIQSIFAISSFYQQKVHHFKMSFKMAVWTLPGSIIGAIVAIKIDDELFQHILAIVLVGVIFSMIFSHENGEQQQYENLNNRKWLFYPTMLGIGFYGGFIQVGVGFILMAALFHL